MRIVNFILFFTLFFAASTTVNSQSIDSLFKQAWQQELSLNEQAALSIYQQILSQKKDIRALCRASELSTRIGSHLTNSGQKLAYYEQAKAYAKQALAIQATSSEANFCMAIAIGKLAMMESGKDKVDMVDLIWQYAEKAIRYNPNSAKAWHVMGKWHAEVSRLTTFEKAAVKLFYGPIREASYQQSIACYEKARAIDPNFVLNYLEMGKVYHKLGKHKEAKEALMKVIQLPNQTAEDPKHKQMARDFLERWF